MNLTDNFTNLIDTIAASHEQERADAKAVYRTILARADRPEPGDAEAISQAMDTLGFTPDRMKADLAALQQAAGLERQAAAFTPEHEAERLAAWEALTTYAEQSDEIKRERGTEERRLRTEASTLTASAAAARRAAGQLTMLRRQHAELFGLEPQEPVRDPQPRLHQGAMGMSPDRVIEYNRTAPAMPPTGQAMSFRSL